MSEEEEDMLEKSDEQVYDMLDEYALPDDARVGENIASYRMRKGLEINNQKRLR